MLAYVTQLDVGIECRGQGRQPVVETVRPEILDGDVAPFREADLVETAAERTVRGPVVPTSSGGPPTWNGGGPTGSVASVSISPTQIRFS